MFGLMGVARGAGQPSGVATFSPLSLFAAGELGAWYDPSDLSTMFQDAAGTVPVTADGNPVRLIRDKSGRSSHATAPSDAARPLYKTSGGLHWLEFDGVDDYLVTSAINFSVGTTMTMAVAETKKLTGVRVPLSIGTAASSDNALYAQAGTGGVFKTAAYYINAVGAVGTPENFATPQNFVIVARGRTSVPYETSLWRNNDAVVTSTANQSATMPNSPIYIGCFRSVTSFLQGSMYGAIVRAAYSSNAEITSIKDYLAAKIGGMP